MTPDEAARATKYAPRCESSHRRRARPGAALAIGLRSFRPQGAKPFASLVPLVEVVGEVLGVERAASAYRAPASN